MLKSIREGGDLRLPANNRHVKVLLFLPGLSSFACWRGVGCVVSQLCSFRPNTSNFGMLHIRPGSSSQCRPNTSNFGMLHRPRSSSQCHPYSVGCFHRHHCRVEQLPDHLWFTNLDASNQLFVVGHDLIQHQQCVLVIPPSEQCPAPLRYRMKTFVFRPKYNRQKQGLSSEAVF